MARARRIIEGWEPSERMVIDLDYFYKCCDLYVKQEKALENFEGFKYMPQEYYEIIYYALIELPSGRHIPLPILLKKYGINSSVLRKIPVSRRIRDDEFFSTPCGVGFYKCHTNEELENFEETSKLKEISFIRLISNGQYKKLKLILPNIFKKYSDCWCDEYEEELEDYEDFEDYENV